MAVYLVFILLFLLEFIVGEKLLYPTKKCIPSATIRSACHLCVCDIDGLYHCRREEICQPNIKSSDPNMRECEANELYREGTTFCSCTASGHWQSNNCRERFQLLRLKKDPIMKHISTNIACKENGLYITDCNVCLCGASGYINFDSCTSRPCPKRLKGDYCNPGDAFRSAKELCICSYMNFFLDHLCIKLVDEVVQPIHPIQLSRIIDIESHTSIDEEQCEGNITLSIDCNTCGCHKNKYICTERICFDDKAALRTKEKSKKSLLLELKSDHEKCIPGKKYRFKCNTCVCNRKGRPLCTSMICLQDLKIDTHAIRQMIVSY